MQLSARNQLKAKVKSVRLGTIMAEVIASARANGSALDDSLIDLNISRTRDMGAYRSSMQIDRQLGRELKKRLNLSIAVIITDTFGRPWREGLTEVAIGIAGMKPLHDDRGRRDPYGYNLRASVEAVVLRGGAQLRLSVVPHELRG